MQIYFLYNIKKTFLSPFDNFDNCKTNDNNDCRLQKI